MIYLGLLLFFVFEYVRPTTFFPGLEPLRLNTIIPVGTGVLNAFSSGRVKNSDFWRDTNGRLLLVLVLMLALSVVMADVKQYALDTFKAVFGYTLIAWVLAKQIADIRRIKVAFLTLIGVHVFLAISTPQMFADTDSRIYIASGTFLSDGNDYALSLNLVIPFCLFLLFDDRVLRKRLIHLGLLVFLIACVVLTKSRGGTIALACVGLYYWVKADRKVLTGVLGAIACVGILLYAPGSYFDRMNTISTQEGSAQARIGAWKAATRMAVDHPLGVGAGHFPGAYSVYRPPDSEGPVRMTAHSIYFLILGELGFLGLAWLLLYIGSNLLANRRLARELKIRSPEETLTDTRLLWSLSASLIALATGGAFLSQVYTPHLYVLAGFMTASRRLIRERHGLLASDAHRGPLPQVVQPASLPQGVLRGRTALTSGRGR